MAQCCCDVLPSPVKTILTRQVRVLDFAAIHPAIEGIGPYFGWNPLSLMMRAQTLV